MSNKGNNIWIYLIILAFIWGSSFILMKRGLFTSEGLVLYSSTQVAALRMLLAGLVLLPVSIRTIRKTKTKTLFWIAMTAIFGNGIPAFLFTAAQTELDSGFVGMLNSLTPIFTFILGMVLFKSKASWLQLVGLLVGLVGAIGLISIGSGSIEFNLSASLMIVAATLCYAISVNIIHSKLSDVNTFTIASIALLIAGIPSGIFLFTTNFTEILMNNPEGINGFFYTLLLAAIGTAAALLLFNKVVQMTNAIIASSVTYLIPIFAVMWGILDGEELSVKHVVFGLIILSGVYLINAKKYQRP